MEARSWRMRICSGTWPIAFRLCAGGGGFFEEVRRGSARVDRPEARAVRTEAGRSEQYAGDTFIFPWWEREWQHVSLIQSLYLSFARAWWWRVRFHLQNRGALFEMDARIQRACGRKRRSIR